VSQRRRDAPEVVLDPLDATACAWGMLGEEGTARALLPNQVRGDLPELLWID
jgi:hypothetical protein